MYLKSIKAYGFKSFADKTEINFMKNINGIVGPNGSGKSNVVDAVRWVLGEQSIKSLRGDSSIDIIFSGSKSRKALNSASVTLIFDNSDMYLPINYTEVSVKRIMYRTGESEYYLNNELCRLKDITGLFIDSGVDKESFNIISQGKIDEILSAKASDRRVVFESAAGVLKYKRRKMEALRKLDRTNSNIERINDIIRELEVNLEPLKKQSEDASKYLELKDNLKEIEVSLIAYDLDKYNYNIENMQSRIDELNDEIAGLSSNNSSYDVELLKKKEELKKIDNDINDCQYSLLELIKNIEKIDANVRVLREREKYTKNNDKISSNIVNIKERILKIDADINNLNLEINNYNSNLVSLNDKKQVINKLIKEYNDKKNKIANGIDKNNRNLTDLNFKIEYQENNINNNNSLPSSIKNIMNNPRLHNCHNVIGKLIEIEDKYLSCINIALGSASNYLVVDSSDDAKEMVKYLKDNKLGRATFFPIDVIKSRSIDDVTLDRIRKVEGFIDIASNLVKYKDVYHNIILNRLGNIIVASDIDTANNISKMINNRYKIVTLDGQVINVGGSVTGGSAISKNNLISEKYELENKKREYDRLFNNNKELEKEMNNLLKDISIKEKELYDINSNIINIEDIINKNKQDLDNNKSLKDNLVRELKDLEAINKNNSDSELESLFNTYYEAISNKDKEEARIEKLKRKKQDLHDSINEIENISKQSNNYINNKEKELNKLELNLSTINIKMDNLLLRLSEEYNMTYQSAVNNYKLELEEDLARERVADIKNSLNRLSCVNLGAIDEYKRVSDRYNFLNSQKEDLHQAEDMLLEIINEMDAVMKDRFLKTFEEIRVEFKKVFKELFGGGEAELTLTEPDNLLDTGIEIMAVPSGKKLKSLSLLSGGEKTFTAISLLFAILNVRPVPFCLLDEVEAALDDANVESFGRYLEKYRDKTQFILITHKKKTMEFADVLYGITMQESGVSKLVSVRLEDIKN
ncbi:MAG: AAA family ATPase [Bacilli bacterium]|nr:AAA family ATPase [Bacilli bacterium]